MYTLVYYHNDATQVGSVDPFCMRVIREQRTPLRLTQIKSVECRFADGMCRFSVTEVGQESFVHVVVMVEVLDENEERELFEPFPIEVAVESDMLLIQQRKNLPVQFTRKGLRTEIHAHLPGPACVRLQMSNGSITMLGQKSGQITCDTGHLYLRTLPASEDFDVCMDAGTAEVDMDASSSLRYDLSVAVGSVVAPNAVQAGVGSQQVKGTVGAGEGSLRVRVNTGTVIMNVRS